MTTIPKAVMITAAINRINPEGQKHERVAPSPKATA